MQSITTKYIPATDTKPERIKATTTTGVSTTVPFSYGEDAIDAHFRAVLKLNTELEWEGELVAGAVKGGFCFVFKNSNKFKYFNLTVDQDIKKETEITEISKHDLKGYLKRLFNSDSPESFAYKNNKDNYRFFEVEVEDYCDTRWEQFYITDIKDQSFVAVKVCIETKAEEFTNNFDFKIKYL